MLPWLLLSVLTNPLRVVHALDNTYGVQPHLLEKYTPLSGDPTKWRCLDGSKTIPWIAVNDDYCDCPDGSDEPGTSACPDSMFYCKNEGHVGAVIRSSRVNDGLCESECCDGSDEVPGLCPNICEKVGKEFRARAEAEAKVRKKGSKIRSSYIAFANKEKKRLEDLVTATSREVAAQEKEVARLKDLLDRTEATSAAELEKKKQSPLYQSLAEHSAALKALKRAYEDLAAKEQTLQDILSSLRGGYNPNYQDMAVLEAVRGYEHYAGLPPSNDRDRGKGEDETAAEEEVNSETKEPETEVLEEGEWNREKLEKELEDLLDTDIDSLLLEHDQHVGADESNALLFDLASYIPDALIPQYELLRDSFVSLLETLGIVRESDSSPDTSKSSKARTTFQDAERELGKIRKEKENAQRELARLFDPEWFGAEGEWKKLDGQCFSKDTGEAAYTYEVCLFGEARQKPNKGGSNFSLGKFSHWNNAEGVEPGSPEYYSKMYYKKGQRCWNGPERSVTLTLTCGTENVIFSVTEPEKCEYHLTGTSPALCRPPEAVSNSAKGKSRKEEL